MLHENAESSLDKEMELDVFVVHRYCGEPVVQQSVHTGVLIALMSNNMVRDWCIFGIIRTY